MARCVQGTSILPFAMHIRLATHPSLITVGSLQSLDWTGGLV